MSTCGQSHADTYAASASEGTYTQVAMRRCFKRALRTLLGHTKSLPPGFLPISNPPSKYMLLSFSAADPSGNTVVDFRPPTKCVSHIIAHLDIGSPHTKCATHAISA
ncbi:hypothetical protein AcV7_007564 [Taiwanofungus camphoratus]|nr:hypothetical protein AcV7_007564 [Antrodia cinnamomea]